MYQGDSVLRARLSPQLENATNIRQMGSNDPSTFAMVYMQLETCSPELAPSFCTHIPPCYSLAKSYIGDLICRLLASEGILCCPPSSDINLASPDDASISEEERRTTLGGVMCVGVELDPKSSSIFRNYSKAQEPLILDLPPGSSQPKPPASYQSSLNPPAQATPNELLTEVLRLISSIHQRIARALRHCSKDYKSQQTTAPLGIHTWVNYEACVASLRSQIRYPADPFDLRRCVAHSINTSLATPVSPGPSKTPFPLFFRVNGCVSTTGLASSSAVLSRSAAKQMAQIVAASSLTKKSFFEQTGLDVRPIEGNAPCQPLDDVYILGLSCGSLNDKIFGALGNTSLQDIAKTPTLYSALDELSEGVASVSLQLIWGQDGLYFMVRPHMVKSDRVSCSARLSEDESEAFLLLSRKLCEQDSKCGTQNLDSMLCTASVYSKADKISRNECAPDDDALGEAYLLPDADNMGEYAWKSRFLPIKKPSHNEAQDSIRLLHESWRALSHNLGCGCLHTFCGCGCGAVQNKKSQNKSHNQPQGQSFAGELPRNELYNERCKFCGDIFELWWAAYGIILPAIPTLVQMNNAGQELLGSKNAEILKSDAPQPPTFIAHELKRVWAEDLRREFELEKAQKIIDDRALHPITLLKPVGFVKLSDPVLPVINELEMPKKSRKPKTTGDDSNAANESETKKLAKTTKATKITKEAQEGKISKPMKDPSSKKASKAQPANVTPIEASCPSGNEQLQPAPSRQAKTIYLPGCHRMAFGVQVVSVTIGTDERILPEPCVRGSELRVISRRGGGCSWSKLAPSITAAIGLLTPHTLPLSNTIVVSQRHAKERKNFLLSNPTIELLANDMSRKNLLAANGCLMSSKPEPQLLSKLKMKTVPLIMPSSSIYLPSEDRLTSQQTMALLTRESQEKLWAEQIAKAVRLDLICLLTTRLSSTPSSNASAIQCHEANVASPLFTTIDAIISELDNTNELQSDFKRKLDLGMASTRPIAPYQPLSIDLIGSAGLGFPLPGHKNLYLHALAESFSICAGNGFNNRSPWPFASVGFMKAADIQQNLGCPKKPRTFPQTWKINLSHLYRRRKRHIALENQLCFSSFVEKETDEKIPIKSPFILFCEFTRSKTRIEVERAGRRNPSPGEITQYLLQKWSKITQEERNFFQQKAIDHMKS